MNKNDFNELLASIREAGKILREEQPSSREFSFDPLDVKKIREKTGLSQRDFSILVHVSLRTLQNWEQGKRSPTGAAKALLRILDRSPELALMALS